MAAIVAVAFGVLLLPQSASALTPESPEEVDEKGPKHAREEWIAWYREIRPDAEFEVD